MKKTGIIVGLGLLGVLGAGLFWLNRPAAPETAATPEEPLTAEAVLALAERYATHEWTATEAHVFHGDDPDGIRVDTPDKDYLPTDQKPGWWVMNAPNIGIPYKWGGFDLPEEFDAGLRAGRYAGDAYSKEKRRLLDDGVSRHTVGVDCSGFVSRCWRLERSYSTRELPQLCDEITDPAHLRPGDIFNTHNAHVRLFAGWADEAKTRVVTYEASARVLREEYDLATMLGDGYRMWRYKKLRAPEMNLP